MRSIWNIPGSHENFCQRMVSTYLLRNLGIWCENVEEMSTVTDFKNTVCSGTWNEGVNVASEEQEVMEEKYFKKEREHTIERGFLGYYIPV